MKIYEESIIRVIMFSQEDIVCTSVSGEDNQAPWDDNWTRPVN